MPRIPLAINAPPSCPFATIRRPKTEKPTAKPTKLIAVDIFSSRFCVVILNAGCRLAARAAGCLAVGLHQHTKALETLSFRKSAELKRHLYQECLFRSQIFLDPGSVEYVLAPEDSPANLMVGGRQSCIAGSNARGGLPVRPTSLLPWWVSIAAKS